MTLNSVSRLFWKANSMSTTRLPVLFLTDLVVLPGMVVPIELDDAARAAVDTAKAHSDDALLVAPRLEDRYASYGGSVDCATWPTRDGRARRRDQGRTTRQDRLRSIRAGHALWVEAEDLPETAHDTEEVPSSPLSTRAL